MVIRKLNVLGTILIASLAAIAVCTPAGAASSQEQRETEKKYTLIDFNDFKNDEDPMGSLLYAIGESGLFSDLSIDIQGKRNVNYGHNVPEKSGDNQTGLLFAMVASGSVSVFTRMDNAAENDDYKTIRPVADATFLATTAAYLGPKLLRLVGLKKEKGEVFLGQVNSSNELIPERTFRVKNVPKDVVPELKDGFDQLVQAKTDEIYAQWKFNQDYALNFAKIKEEISRKINGTKLSCIEDSIASRLIRSMPVSYPQADAPNEDEPYRLTEISGIEGLSCFNFRTNPASSGEAAMQRSFCFIYPNDEEKGPIYESLKIEAERPYISESSTMSIKSVGDNEINKLKFIKIEGAPDNADPKVIYELYVPRSADCCGKNV